jgi:hypothetical protein
MRPHVGGITGALIGNIAEAIGTSTITVPRRGLPHCHPINGSIQEAGIRNRWSTNISFNSRNIVISRMNPSCSNTIKVKAGATTRVRASTKRKAKARARDTSNSSQSHTPP